MQSDRYGDIADLDARAARGHARRAARHAPGAARPRPARACARWCSAARAAWGSSPRRRSTSAACPPERTILGYLFPDWAAGARRDARHRRERGGAVGHARVRRPRDARSRSPRARTRRSLDKLQSTALKTFLQRRRGFDARARCASSFIGYEGSERHVDAPAQARSARSSSATAGCASARAPASSTTRRSSTRPTSATSCSTAARPPTSPRPRRRGASSARCYDAVIAAGPRRASPSSASAATSCATCRTATTRARACTSRSRSCRGRARRRSTSTAWSSRRSSRRSSTTARTLSHHHAVGTEHAAVARAGHLGAGRRDAARAVRRDRPGRQPQPGQDRRDRAS